MDMVNDVLSKVSSALGLDRRLREHTLASMWPTFVSGAVADRSRPLFIDSAKNFVVSVADASTGQELSMMKTKVLAQLIPSARALGIEIKGIRLDMKHFRELVADPSANFVQHQAAPHPTDDELQAVELFNSDKEEIANLEADLAKGEPQPAALHSRIVRLFELEMKLRRWRLENGFSPCQKCGVPADRLHRATVNEKSVNLCLACLYS